MAVNKTTDQNATEGENFWAGAAPDKKNGAPQTKPPGKGRMWRKIAIGSLIGIVVLVIIVFAAGMGIASSIAPGIIESKAGEVIAGKVKVQRTSFSWGGPQVIGPIALADPQGKEVGLLKIETTAGVWGLLTGYLSGAIDLGQIDVTGRAAVVREKEGSTNLERAVEPRSKPAQPTGGGTPAKSEPGTIQLGDFPAIKAKIAVKDVDITYTDANAQAGTEPYVLRGFTANGDVDVNSGTGVKAVMDLSSKIGQGTAPAGEFTLQGRVDMPSTAGSARISDAKVNAKIAVVSAPVDVIDALAMQKGKLITALGKTADVSMTVSGDMQNAEASIKADTPNARADLAFTIKDGLATSSKPGTVRAKGESIRALVPAIDEALAGQKIVTLQQLPDVAVDIRGLSLRIPRDPAKLDLRGTALDLAVTTSAFGGSVVLENAQQPSAFNVTPMSVAVVTKDLAGPSTVQLATSATVDGRPGGDLKVDLTTTNLLDASGAPAPGNVAVQGTVTLDNLATAIAQPFVQAMKIDLPRDIGPELDVKLAASTTPAPAGSPAGTLPATAIDVDIQAANIRAKASLELVSGVLKTRENGISADIATAGSIASRFVDPATGFSVVPSGQASVRIKSLSVPLPTATAPFNIGDISGDIEAKLTGLSLASTSPSASAGPVDIQAFTAQIGLVAKGTPRIVLDGVFSHDRQPFSLKSNLELAGLFAVVNGTTAISPQTVRPRGTLELINVPVSLAALLPKSQPVALAPMSDDLRGLDGFDASTSTSPSITLASYQPGNKPAPQPTKPSPTPTAPGTNQPPRNNPPAGQPGATQPAASSIDIAGLLKGAVGPTATIKLASVPNGEALDVTMSMAAQHTAVEVAAGVQEKLLDLTKATVVTTISPATVESLTETFLKDSAQPPRLRQTTRATITVAPIKIPLTQSIFSGFKPDVANAPDASLTVALPDRTLVEGIVVANADGTSRDLGAVGVEKFMLSATFPPALLAGADAKWSKQASAKLEGNILSGENEVLMTLGGDMTAKVSAAGPQDTFPLDSLRASLNLRQVAIGPVERLASQERGFISGAIGDVANLTVLLAVDAPETAKSLDDSTINVDATVDTPKLKIPEPVRLRMLPDRFAIGSPIKLTWDMDPRWLNMFLEPAKTQTAALPGQPAAAPAQAAAKFTKPATLRAEVTSLAIGRGTDRGPLAPGIFGLEASALLPAIEMLAQDGSTILMDATTMKITSRSSAPAQPSSQSGNQPNQQGQPPQANAGPVIDLDISIASATVNRQGAAPARAEKMAVNVSLSKLSDAQGNVNAETATVDARGDLPVIPVPLLDILAKQDGMLTEALGPVAQANIRATQLSKTGGSLEFSAKSSRASAQVRGTIQNDVFATTAPLNVTILEVTPELTHRFLKGVPLIGAVKKTPQDQPATIIGNSLKVPLGGDLSKLNGQIVVDPGEASFEAGGDFANLLKALKSNTEGHGGKKLEPLTVDIANGIATYQRWSLPIGEFAVKTEGTVDLVNRKLDVITWLPIGSLTDEAAGLFKSGGGLSQLFGGKSQEELATATMVPFRTRGTYENNRTEPDLELFAKEFVNTLKPEDALKRGLEELLKRQGRTK
jgi:hypothetical protein